jgi:protein-tyrosine phosphatase
MRLGILFVSLGIAAFLTSATGGGWTWLVAWPGISMLILGAGYLGIGACVFGKRRNGTRAWWASLLMAPYILIAWLIWRAMRWVRHEPCCHALIPGVIIGRRAAAREIPAEVVALVDLTAEMWEARHASRNRHYLCHPILDGSVPPAGELVELVRTVLALEGPVYIHCAEGRGRAGLVAVALLIASKTAENVDDALRLARERRPCVRLSPSQNALARDLCEELRSLNGKSQRSKPTVRQLSQR